MRVLVVCPPYLPGVGGVQRVVGDLCSELARRGVVVRVLTERCLGLPAREIRDGVEVIRCLAPRLAAVPPAVAWLVRLASYSLHLLRHAGQFDLMHFHQAFHLVWPAVLACRVRGVPLAVSVHATGPVEGVEGMIARYRGGRLLAAALSSADAVVAITDIMRAELIRCGVPEERMVGIPYGLNLTRFRPRPEQRAPLRAKFQLPEEPVLLFPARLVPGKGHEILFEAASRLLRAGRRLCVALLGDGPEKARLRVVASELGLDDTVRWVGSVEEIEEWLAAADLFVFPSRTEGWSLALGEALASGLPVVVSDIPVCRSILADGERGWLFRDGDPESMALTIANALDDAQGRIDRATMARKAMEEFSVQRQADRTLSLYERLLRA